MYCYCIEKSETKKKKKKRSANKNGYHFENFWGCLQIFVLWGLAGMVLAGFHVGPLILIKLEFGNVSF